MCIKKSRKIILILRGKHNTAFGPRRAPKMKNPASWAAAVRSAPVGRANRRRIVRRLTRGCVSRKAFLLAGWTAEFLIPAGFANLGVAGSAGSPLNLTQSAVT
jgi:hypothetical protein